MRPRPSVRWIWGLAFLLVLGPALVWWLVTPSLKVYPVGWMLPDRVSCVARLAKLETAWQRHWQGRPQTAPENALKELMEALEEWPRWVKKYGQRGAETRLWLYQRALFNAVGEEAWLVFGEYGGTQTGTGEVGLVALIRTRSSVATRVGDLMNLVMSEYQLATHKHGGVTIYEYQDKKVSRNVTFCQIGGWICASLQQKGLGPLPAIIDRIAERRAAKVPEIAVSWLNRPERVPAISMAAWPERFWGQLRVFRQQRGEGFSDESEERLDYWQQRLDGIDRIELVQTGNSIFDLKMDMIGPRPAELTKSLKFRPGISTAVQSEMTSDTRSQLAQLDLSLGLARLMTPLAGVPTDDMMKGLKKLKPWVGRLGDELRDRIQDLPPDVEGRMGLAIYPGVLLPQGTVWLDDAPERVTPASPGQYWPRLASAEPDKVFTVPAILEPTTRTLKVDPGWLAFERRVWMMAPPRPILFATVQFERVANEIHETPGFLLGKKAKKNLRKTERVMRAIALAAGGAALRVDAMEDRWVARVETP